MGRVKGPGMLAVVAGALAVQLIPERARAADEVVGDSPCMDHAWGDYNSCLVSSRYEFQKRLCDARFLLDTAICAGRQE